MKDEISSNDSAMPWLLKKGAVASAITVDVFFIDSFGFIIIKETNSICAKDEVD